MNIYEAINNVMADIGAIGKNKKNAQQGFNYRGVDDVMNALQPALIKHKVFIVPEILEQTREERQSQKGGTLLFSICKIRYTFYAEDGSNIYAVVIGEGMDSGDKATNKAMAIGFKYACFQVFCIPTEEMKDPDGDSPQLAGEDPGKKKIDAVKKQSLMAMIEKTGTQPDEILRFLKLDSFDDMTVEDYMRTMKTLEKKQEIAEKAQKTKGEKII